MQRTRNEFLASAGLAGNKHSGRRVRQSADRTKHVLHRRSLAEHFGRIAERGLSRERAAHALVDGAMNQLDGTIDVERLREIFECAALKRGDSTVEIRVRRHDDDGQLRKPFANRLQQLESRRARHPDVGHEHLGRLVFERGERFAHVGEAAGREIFARQRFFKHPADRLVVVYYPDRLHTGVVFFSRAATNLKLRVSGAAFHLDQPVVLLHKGLRERETQPAASLAS